MAKQRFRTKKIKINRKPVKVLQCECSWDGSKQAGFERFDYCACNASYAKGKKGAITSIPGEYIVSTIFIKGYKK